MNLPEKAQPDGTEEFLMQDAEGMKPAGSSALKDYMGSGIGTVDQVQKYCRLMRKVSANRKVRGGTATAESPGQPKKICDKSFVQM